MDSLRGMHILVRAIELGSLTAAARELGVTQPSVSKTIAALERQLAVRLIERTTTRFTPTEAGLRFYERAKNILEEFAEACADVQGSNAKMAGLVRVNAPLGLGEMHLHRMVQNFVRAHPEVEVELILNDRFVDLVEEGVDLAIRLGGALAPTAVARDLATAERFLVASPHYLSHHPSIESVDDLQMHQFVRFAWLESGAKVELFGAEGARQVALKGRYSVNSALSIRQAVCDGLGLAMTPAWLVQDLLDQGGLVRVLPGWRAASQTLRLVYPSRRYQPLRVRALMDHLQSEITALPGLAPLRPLLPLPPPAAPR